MANSMFVDKRLPKSAAFLSLKTSTAAQVLMILFHKRVMERHRGGKPKQKYICTNGQELQFSFAEAEQYGISRGKFRRAIDELMSRGFVTITETGSGLHRVANRYGLSDEWLRYGQEGFQPATRPEPSQYNNGFRPGNRLGRGSKKKESSVTHAHGAVCMNEHGPIFAVRTCEHGQKIIIPHNQCDDGYLCLKIA